MSIFLFPALSRQLFRLTCASKPRNLPAVVGYRVAFGLFFRRVAIAFMVVVGLSFNGQSIAVEGPSSETPRKILFLGVKFQNDHESQEPTSDAERGRLHAIEEIFRSQLESTGKFRFIPASADIQSKINEGQSIGDCGGCEIDYGAKSGADVSAWIVVQKVSNLILNINLYMVDVSQRKIILTQSVDIRGNTDQSWTRGMNYLVKNHILGDRAVVGGH